MPNLDDESVEEVRHCVGCTTRIDEYTEVGFEGTRGPVCTNCHVNCHGCGNDFNDNSGATHAYVGGDSYCARCTRNDWFICNHCDDWTHVDESHGTTSGYSVCENCRDQYYHFCDNCEQYVDDDYQSEHQSNCYDNGEIHGYDYRPNPIFLHNEGEVDNAPIRTINVQSVIRNYRQVAYMGFELEMEYFGRGRSSFGDGVESCDIHDVTYLKSDGSLNHGFEMVTHPMTLAWAMENFPWQRIEQLNDGSFEGWGGSTAGLHIHVSRDGFANLSHQARFVHLITRNQNLYEILAGRSSERWANFNNDNLRNISRKLRRIESSERYSAVNLQNRATLEVRIFQSSLKPERIKMCLQLVDASVKYTENLSCNDMVTGKAFSSKSFIAWVATRPEYEILNSYLDTFSSTGQVGE